MGREQKIGVKGVQGLGLSSGKDGVAITMDPVTMQPVGGRVGWEWADQKVGFRMLSLRSSLDVQVETGAYNWTSDSGIQRRGLGWRLKFGTHQFINSI